MSVLDRLASLEVAVEELQRSSGVQGERISGEGGLVKAVKTLGDDVRDEVKALRRTMWTVGGTIMTSSVAFAFTVLLKLGG